MRDKGSIGIAIIGCGYWGVNYVRVFNSLPMVDPLVICDARVDRLQEVGQRFPDAQQVTDLATVLASEEITAVVIATGATTHFDVAQRCLEAGKHVLIEKPMTTTTDTAHTLVDIAKSKQVKLMVGHTFLYNSAVWKVKEYLQSQDLGKIYYLYAQRTNLGPVRHDVNAIWDLAPHDISIFNYLLDQTPTWVSAVGTHVLGNDRADVGFISLGYADNIVGNIHVSWADPHKVRELVVVGSNKRIVFDDMNVSERVRVHEKGITIAEPKEDGFAEYQYFMRDGDIVSPRIEASEPLKNQCRHFLSTVQNGRLPRSDGQAGLEIVKIMEAIDQSIQQQGSPVFIQ